MQITAMSSLPINYRDKKGNENLIILKPGKHSYPKLDYKDPMVAEQLRIYRKHRSIGFDELLACDQEMLKSINGKPDEKLGKLVEAFTIKTGASRRTVKGVKRNAATAITAPPAPAANTGRKKDRDKS